MSKNKETNQNNKETRSKRIGAAVRLALAGTMASIYMGASHDRAQSYSADQNSPQSIHLEESSTLEEGIPSEVVTPKDIHPVTNWVTQLPNEEITIPAGMTLQVLGTDHGLYVVAYGGEEHLVPKTLVEVKSSEASTGSTTSTEQITPVETRETTAAVNKRKGPGTNFDTLGVIPEGTTVIILEDQGTGWAKVQIDGSDEEFYLSTDFLDNPQFIQAPVSENESEAIEDTQPITTTEAVPSTAPITNTDTVTDATITHPEAIGGHIEEEQLLTEAQEALGSEVVEVMSVAHDTPVVLDSKANVVGVYKNSKWEEYKFPEEIGVSQATKSLEEVQTIFSNAKDARFSVGVIYITDQDSKEFVRVENGNIIPSLEESLIKFINRDPNLKPNLDLDSIIVKSVSGTYIAEVNNFYFLYSPKGWILTTPDIEAQLITSPPPVVTEADNGEYLVQPDEISVTLKPGYDFEGRVTLDENAEQVILEWLAESIAQSGVLSPIMGNTKEAVLEYLRANNYQMPPQTELPSQLPRVFADVSTHDRVKFVPPNAPINLNNIELQFFWNDEADKFQNVEQLILWSGNSAGEDGCGIYVDETGKLIMVVVTKRRSLYDEDPVTLERASARNIYIATHMFSGFNGNDLAGGDEFAFQHAFVNSQSLPKVMLDRNLQVVNIIE